MVAAAAAVVVGNLLAACQSPQDQMNEVQRATWDERTTSAKGEWRDAERELWLVEERTRSLRQRTVEERTKLAEVRKQQEQQAARLAIALRTLQSMEEDLVAARDRRVGLEKELADVLALETKLAERDRLLTELTTTLAEQDQLLAVKRKELSDKQASVAVDVARIDAELAKLTAAQEKMRAALEAAKPSPPAAESGPAKSAEPVKKN